MSSSVAIRTIRAPGGTDDTSMLPVELLSACCAGFAGEEFDDAVFALTAGRFVLAGGGVVQARCAAELTTTIKTVKT